MLPFIQSEALRPDIFANGSLTEQPFKKIKAFTDVGNIEAMSKTRWGAAKRVWGQPRMSWPRSLSRKKRLRKIFLLYSNEKSATSYIKHDNFPKILEPAWNKAEDSEANVMAVLKRTYIVLSTKSFLCAR